MPNKKIEPIKIVILAIASLLALHYFANYIVAIVNGGYSLIIYYIVNIVRVAGLILIALGMVIDKNFTKYGICALIGVEFITFIVAFLNGYYFYSYSYSASKYYSYSDTNLFINNLIEDIVYIAAIVFVLLIYITKEQNSRIKKLWFLPGVALLIIKFVQILLGFAGGYFAIGNMTFYLGSTISLFTLLYLFNTALIFLLAFDACRDEVDLSKIKNAFASGQQPAPAQQQYQQPTPQPTPAPTPQPAPQSTFCTKCGNKLTPGTKFCASCGAPVGK